VGNTKMMEVRGCSDIGWADIMDLSVNKSLK
jgi:hypothetical protein